MDDPDTSDNRISPLAAPLPFAVLAAQIANFSSDGEGASSQPSRQDAPATDFVLDYAIAPGLTLSVEHDASLPGFTVRAVCNAVPDLDRITPIALRLNHHLPPGMRFSLEESSPPQLQVCQTLQATGLELDHLAWAITQTSEAMQLALAPEVFDEDAQGPAAPDLSTWSNTMIRG